MDLDDRVRLEVYRYFVEHARPPVAAELAPVVGVTAGEIEDAYRRLADAHVLVLAAGTPYIWLANPLSALPSPFRVDTDRRTYWGICIWDALGILAMLDADGTVATYCPDCSQPLQLEVRDGTVVRDDDAVIHFSVPAAHFWDDIGFT